MHVLVVDDNHANREVARHILELETLKATTVTSGRTAVAVAREQAFDAILMDINMPGMCGVEATHHLRTLENPDHRPPIFALTAFASPMERRTYKDAGLDAVIAKPLEFPAFVDALRDYTAAETFQAAVFERHCRAVGLPETTRIYTHLLVHAVELREQGPPRDYLGHARSAERLGLQALARRLTEAARAAQLWRPICHASIQREAGFVLAAVKRIRAAALSPGRDAHSA